MSAKSLAKTAREALDREDYATALRLTQAALDALDDGQDTLRYTLLVFRATALRNTADAAGAERDYRAAAALLPDAPLAWQGLAALLEGRPEAVPVLERLVSVLGRAAAEGKVPAEKAHEARMRLVSALEAAARHADAASVLRDMAPADSGPLDLVSHYVRVQEAAEEKTIAAEIHARRHRLGAPPLADLSEIVRTEVVRASDLEPYVRRLCADGGPDVRRTHLCRLVDRLQRLVPAMPQRDRLPASEELLAFAEECGCVRCRSLVFNLTDRTWDFEHAESADATESQSELHMALLQTRGEDAIAAVRRARSIVHGLSTSYGTTYPKLSRSLDCIEGVARAKRGDSAAAIQLLSPLVDLDDRLRPFVLDALRAERRYADAVALQEGRPLSWFERVDLAWDCALAGRTDDALAMYADALNNADLITADESSQSAETMQNKRALALARCAWLTWEHRGDVRSSRASDAPYGLAMAAAQMDARLSLPFHVLGRFYVLSRDAVRAERCLAKALANDGSCVDAAQALARLQLDAQRGADALRTLAPFTAAPENARNAPLWRLAAASAVQARAWESAAAAWQAVLRGTPADDAAGRRAALLGMSEAYRRTGRHAAAARALGVLLAAGADADAAALLAAVQCDAGLYAEAAGALSLVLGRSVRLHGVLHDSPTLEDASWEGTGVAANVSDGEILFGDADGSASSVQSCPARCGTAGLGPSASGPCDPLGQDEAQLCTCHQGKESGRCVSPELRRYAELLLLRVRAGHAGALHRDGCVRACDAECAAALDAAVRLSGSSDDLLAAQCVLEVALVLMASTRMGRALGRATAQALDRAADALRKLLSTQNDGLCRAADEMAALEMVSAAGRAAVYASVALVRATGGHPDAWVEAARVLLHASPAGGAAALGCLSHAELDAAGAAPASLVVAAAAHMRSGGGALAQHYACRAVEALPAAAVSDARACAETAPVLVAAWLLLSSLYAERGALEAASEAAERPTIDAAAVSGPAWFALALLAARAGADGSTVGDRLDVSARLCAASFAPAHAAFGLLCPSSSQRTRIALLRAAQHIGDPSVLSLRRTRSAAPVCGTGDIEAAVRTLERDPAGLQCEAGWLALAAACRGPSSLPADARVLLLDWLAARLGREAAADVSSPAVAACALAVWRGVYASLAGDPAGAPAGADADGEPGPGAKRIPDDVRRALERVVVFFRDALPYAAA